MTTQSQSVLDAALGLNENERVWLVERLLETLPPEASDATDEPAWEAELDRRYQEAIEGKSAPITWEELRGQA